MFLILTVFTIFTLEFFLKNVEKKLNKISFCIDSHTSFHRSDTTLDKSIESITSKSNIRTSGIHNAQSIWTHPLQFPRHENFNIGASYNIGYYWNKNITFYSRIKKEIQKKKGRKIRFVNSLFHRSFLAAAQQTLLCCWNYYGKEHKHTQWP